MKAPNAIGATFLWCAGWTALVVLAMATTGCAQEGKSAADATAEGLVELQAGLQPGQAPEWYTQRLSDLGYRIASLRYEQADVLTYEVDKAASRFRVRIGLDGETGAAGNIEIQPVVVAGIEVVPAGSRIWGYVAEVEAASRPNKGGRLVLKARTIETRGNAIEFQGLVTAEGAPLEGEDSVKEDLKEIAVGAGIGGLVGGLLGGGKGVLAGVLIGGGGTFVATKGEQLELPPDTQLYVELRQEVSIPID